MDRPEQPAGILYGVGVGPGDPGLLTLKAVAVLGAADVIYAAASTKNDYSVSLSVARPHLREGAAVRTLAFPMTRDEAALAAAWEKNARIVLADMEAGLGVAFLTLGDPMTYSTFGYLLATVQRLAPGARVEIVPGVTSYAAAAALSGRVLAQREETLAIVSGAAGGDALRRSTPSSGRNERISGVRRDFYLPQIPLAGPSRGHAESTKLGPCRFCPIADQGEQAHHLR